MSPNRQMLRRIQTAAMPDKPAVRGKSQMSGLIAIAAVEAMSTKCQEPISMRLAFSLERNLDPNVPAQSGRVREQTRSIDIREELALGAGDREVEPEFDTAPDPVVVIVR